MEIDMVQRVAKGGDGPQLAPSWTGVGRDYRWSGRDMLATCTDARALTDIEYEIKPPGEAVTSIGHLHQ
jgi:hypothetical protein